VNCLHPHNIYGIAFHSTQPLGVLEVSSSSLTEITSSITELNTYIMLVCSMGYSPRNERSSARGTMIAEKTIGTEVI
jgi:hypothetical protein